MNIAHHQSSKLRSFLLGLICLVSALASFVRLDLPNSVVFDEVHFGKYVNSYCCTGSRIFDVHPPLGRILTAGWVRLTTSYRGGFEFDSIGKPYPPELPAELIRFPAAFATFMVPILSFWILELLSVNLWIIFGACFGLAMENAMHVHGRMFGFDTMQLAFTALALLFAIKVTQSATNRMELVHAVLFGVCAGSASSIKMSGLGAFAFAPIMWFLRPQILKTNYSNFTQIKRYILLFTASLLTGFLVWFGTWYLHFALLQNPGVGDAFLKPTGNFFHDVWALNLRMIAESAKLSGAHPYASPWWSWPIVQRSIFYWSQDDRVIYLLPNLIIWVGGAIGALIAWLPAVYTLMSTRYPAYRRSKDRAWIVLSLTAVYLSVWLPFAGLRRVLFLYHYITPMWVSVLLVAVSLDAELNSGMDRHTHFFTKSKKYIFLGFLALVCAGWLFVAPLTFAWQAQEYAQTIFSIFKSWR